MWKRNRSKNIRADLKQKSLQIKSFVDQHAEDLLSLPGRKLLFLQGFLHVKCLLVLPQDFSFQLISGVRFRFTQSRR